MLCLRFEPLDEIGDLIADLLGLLAYLPTRPLAFLLELPKLRRQRHS